MVELGNTHCRGVIMKRYEKGEEYYFRKGNQERPEEVTFL